jgi:hypothetical protein
MADSRCPTCQAHRDATPPDAALKILLSDHFDAAAGAFAFHPVPRTPEQQVATQLLAEAIGRYVRAFGLGNAAPRIASVMELLRIQAKVYCIHERRIEARRAVVAEAQRRGDYASPDVADPFARAGTPEYPGRAEDDAWLTEVFGHAA